MLSTHVKPKIRFTVTGLQLWIGSLILQMKFSTNGILSAVRDSGDNKLQYESHTHTPHGHNQGPGQLYTALQVPTDDAINA